MKRLLVLCIDRDNDVERKTKFKTPVLGRRDNVSLATAMGLSDPEESDTNAIFEAIKMSDHLSKEAKVEIATLSGDQSRGIEADKRISKQLDGILKRHKYDGAVLVTDGVGDEYVMPIIQSKISIISVRRVIVSQSESMEGAYYMMEKFLRQTTEDPKTARLVLGLPAIALLLFAFLGSTGWRFVLGAIALYLLVKGFQLENITNFVVNEAKFAISQKRISLFMYISSIALIVIAASTGFDAIKTLSEPTPFVALAKFVNASVYIFFFAQAIAWVGWLIAHPKLKTLTLLILGFSVAFLLFNATEVVLNPAAGFSMLIVSILFGFLLIVTTLALEYKK